MVETKTQKPDISKIRLAVQTGIPLSITTYTLPHEMEMYMNDVISIFLKELGQEQMTEYLTYCLNELITNAKKANTKRIYFRDKKLNINKPEEYDSGMKDFKQITLNNINYYLQEQKEAGLYVRLILQTKKNKIRVEVRNNSDMTVFEYKRVHDKLARAQQYTSDEEALAQVLDDTEGAGLGLIIIILMLEKIGLTEDNFQVLCENNETITRIILPVNQQTIDDLQVLSQELVNSIETLPQFPDNITVINRMLADKKTKLSDIATRISNDISLTADLLRQVNSAAFALASPCKSIGAAVKMVGIRGIRNLLFSIGTIQSLGSSSPEQKILWSHSYKVAFYTYNLARNFCANKPSVIEDSYVCGLLHDIGRIVFDTAHPDFQEKCASICQKRKIPSQLLEKLEAGANHAEIGALIAEKWKLPDVIVQTARYHHCPESAPAENRTIVSIVYLANMMTYYQNGQVGFSQIDSDIFAQFKITNEEQFASISNKLKKTFKEDN